VYSFNFLEVPNLTNERVKPLLYMKYLGIMKKVFLVLVLLFTIDCFSQYDRARPSDAYDLSEDAEDMTDEEFDRYIKKQKKKSERKDWIFYSVVVGGVIYLIYNSDKKNNDK
jgi:hypothetical protein